jgi:hypothetical protein
MIIEQYVHTLVPVDPQFSPTSEQVSRFLEGLSALDAAPLNPEVFVLKPSGRLRSFKNPLTGETKSFPAKDRVPLKSIADVASVIEGLKEYGVCVDGQGPPGLPPFPLYFENSLFSASYGFTVGCSLRPEPVSMSDLGDEQTGNEVVVFGQACPQQSRTALFRHPGTGELIEVAHAGCARFWVDFEFGKWLLPKIGTSLDILNPDITKLATECFGLPFAQGFHYY